MSSLLQGFRSGFDMMDRYFRNQESDRRFSEQMALQRQQAERAGQQHEASMQSHALNTQLLQEQVNDLPVQREHRDSVRALELDTARQQNEVSKFNLSSAKDRKRQSDAKERLGMYAASGDWAGFLTDKSFQNTNAGLLQSVEGADSAIALSDSISNNDLPGIIQHANALFKSKLNRNVGKMEGRNGATIRDISIINMEQAEGGKTKLRVRVTTDNGPYESYISEMRGIDPNDPDKQFTADELLGTAAVMGNLAHTLKSSGVYERLAQVGERAVGQNANQVATKPDWKEIAIYDETGNKKGLAGFYDPNTGQYRAIPSQLKDEIANAASNPEDLAARNEKVNSQAIQYVLSVLVQQGIDQGDAQAIANKVIETANQYKAAGQKADMNKLTSTITQQYLQAKKARQQNAAKRAEESQQRLLALPSKGLF